MADRNYSSYQKKVIQRYYDNRDAIDTTRLSEQVTTLYLATGKKLETTWASVEKTLVRLGVKESRVKHILDSRDPTVLAELVKDLEAGRIELKPPKKGDGKAKPDAKNGKAT